MVQEDEGHVLPADCLGQRRTTGVSSWPQLSCLSDGRKGCGPACATAAQVTEEGSAHPGAPPLRTASPANPGTASPPATDRQALLHSQHQPLRLGGRSEPAAVGGGDAGDPQHARPARSLPSTPVMWPLVYPGSTVRVPSLAQVCPPCLLPCHDTPPRLLEKGLQGQEVVPGGPVQLGEDRGRRS